MCKLLSMRKWQTTLYHHPQMNGLVERSHQTIMWMIEKLEEDKEANWPGHLAEIVHAYSATQSTMMGYSPHYLMFGHRPRLLVNFYFPTFRSTEVQKRGTSAKCVNEYMATVHDQLRATLCEAQALNGKSPMTEMVLQLKDRCCWPEAWWSCLNEGWHIPGKEEDKEQVRGQTPQGSASDHNRCPLVWSDKPMQTVTHPTLQMTSPHCIRNWHPLCMGVPQAWGRCTSPTPVKPTPKESDSETMPWEDSGLVITQHQDRKTSLVWINGKLWLLPWTSTGASTVNGWRLQVMCSGSGCL